MGLTGISDSASLPDKKVMKKELKLKFVSYFTVSTELIANQSFVCTTADIWSCINENYLGIACHFIKEKLLIKSCFLG